MSIYTYIGCFSIYVYMCTHTHLFLQGKFATSRDQHEVTKQTHTVWSG